MSWLSKYSTTMMLTLSNGPFILSSIDESEFLPSITKLYFCSSSLFIFFIQTPSYFLDYGTLRQDGPRMQHVFELPRQVLPWLAAQCNGFPQSLHFHVCGVNSHLSIPRMADCLA